MDSQELIEMRVRYLTSLVPFANNHSFHLQLHVFFKSFSEMLPCVPQAPGVVWSLFFLLAPLHKPSPGRLVKAGLGCLPGPSPGEGSSGWGWGPWLPGARGSFLQLPPVSSPEGLPAPLPDRQAGESLPGAPADPDPDRDDASLASGSCSLWPANLVTGLHEFCPHGQGGGGGAVLMGV